jgi:HAD superfamily phosphoserine phosphatase-like hydrolase
MLNSVSKNVAASPKAFATATPTSTTFLCLKKYLDSISMNQEKPVICTFFDVDRTIRSGSAALDFCNYLANQGVISPDFETKDSLVREQYKNGNRSYSQMVEGVVTLHAGAMAGLSQEKLNSYYQGYIRENNAFFEWVEPLFTLLKNNNIATILISAGIFPAIDAIGKHLQVDHIFTSSLEEKDGQYTGKVKRILHDDDKQNLVEDYLTQHNNVRKTLGFGDSTGDVSMLQRLQHVFIIDPHQPEMKEIANKNNWPIYINGNNLILDVEKIIIEKNAAL